ncbi:MAG: hypothetical protein IIX47_07395 [Spirochaetaceae bacterium]|nr:hypothetical protein [Spirochaetaceae bacterium]
MVSGINVLNPTSYSPIVNGGVGSGKVYVQVKPNQVVYSQFEHVSGYASKSNPDSGISVSKINILNTLIDQLVKIQSDTTKPKLPTDLTDSQVDVLIKDYQDKIQTALNVAKTNPFALSGGNSLGKGLIVNTLV